MVQAEITKISKVPITVNDNKSLVLDVQFPYGLTTNYGIKLETSEEMHGSSEIITENLNLLQRIINPFKHIIKKNT